MTRKRFTKLLRSMGVPKSIIDKYVSMVIMCGGSISYKEIYDTIIKCLVKQIIGGYKQPELEFASYEFDFNDNQTNYLLNTYGAKVVEPMYVRRVTL